MFTVYFKRSNTVEETLLQNTCWIFLCILIISMAGNQTSWTRWWVLFFPLESLEWKWSMESLYLPPQNYLSLNLFTDQRGRGVTSSGAIENLHAHSAVRWAGGFRSHHLLRSLPPSAIFRLFFACCSFWCTHPAFCGSVSVVFFFQNNLLKMHSISVQIKTQTMHII